MCSSCDGTGNDQNMELGWRRGLWTVTEETCFAVSPDSCSASPGHPAEVRSYLGSWSVSVDNRTVLMNSEILPGSYCLRS